MSRVPTPSKTSPETSEQLRYACAQAILGDPGPLLLLSHGEPQEQLIPFITRHGVAALIYDTLTRTGVEEVPQTGVLHALQRLTRLQAARSLMQEAELKTLDLALEKVAIPCLTLKGTPLAYNVYPSPALRARADIDLLFDDADIILARRLLMELGYTCQPAVTPLAQSVYLTTQLTCTRCVEQQIRGVVDAHWRVSNSLIFANAFPFAELEQTAVPVGSLDRVIRAPNLIHCLLIACFHRLTEPHRDRLLWTYDIHLLIERLTPFELDRALDIAIDRRLASVLLDGLTTARDTFQSAVEGERLRRLEEAKTKTPEPAERFLKARNNLGRRVADFQSLSSWRRRLHMLGVTLFPPKSYLELQGLRVDRVPLLWLHLQRWTQGLKKPGSG